MKQIRKAGLLLAAILCLTFTACGGSTEDLSGTATQAENTEFSIQSVQEAQTEAVSDEVQQTETALQSDTETESQSTDSKGALPGGTLTVHYMDIGQGDATLITCDGSSMLIDAGNNNKGTAVQMYLQKQGITQLDYVIGTHPDADHIGGLDVVITKFDCKTVFLTDEKKNTRTYEDVIDALKYKNITATEPVVGTSYALGGAEFTIVGPVNKAEDSNDNSIAILLQYGDTRFYFEGDASEKEEADILGTGMDVRADVYKIGHHGSRTSTSDAMLAAVDPVSAVISAGEGNSYGHPHAEVLNKLRAKGVQVYRTDEQGTIVASSDGQTVTFQTSPSESWQAGEPTGSAADDTADESAEDTAQDGTQSTGEDESKTDASRAASAGQAAASVTEGVQQEVSDASAGQNSAASQQQDAADQSVSQDTAAATDGAGSVMVHITDTGNKYHSAGCQYLKKSDREISLEQAKSQGYEPCKRCNPPR